MHTKKKWWQHNCVPLQMDGIMRKSLEVLYLAHMHTSFHKVIEKMCCWIFFLVAFCSILLFLLVFSRMHLGCTLAEYQYIPTVCMYAIQMCIGKWPHNIKCVTILFSFMALLCNRIANLSANWFVCETHEEKKYIVCILYTRWNYADLTTNSINRSQRLCLVNISSPDKM